MCVHFTQRRGQQAGLLFVCQTDWQQQLLRRYGSICLLDATYRTTRYTLPLFFLCVRTNVDYVVVATFVTQSEDSGSIAEAVQTIRSWNPDWTPQSFMVDFCEAEINALGSVFPGTHAQIQCIDWLIHSFIHYAFQSCQIFLQFDAH